MDRSNTIDKGQNGGDDSQSNSTESVSSRQPWRPCPGQNCLDEKFCNPPESKIIQTIVKNTISGDETHRPTPVTDDRVYEPTTSDNEEEAIKGLMKKGVEPTTSGSNDIRVPKATKSTSKSIVNADAFVSDVKAHTPVTNDRVYEPTTSDNEEEAIKGLMKKGVEQRELESITEKHLPDKMFHGVILEEDIRKKTENGTKFGSYYIRISLTGKTFPSCQVQIKLKNDPVAKTFRHYTVTIITKEKGELYPSQASDRFDNCTAIIENAKILEINEEFIDCKVIIERDEDKLTVKIIENEKNTLDHCAAMVIEPGVKEYFDSNGHPPNLEDFFTKHNTCQLQSSGYNTCAFHCAYYLVERNNGFTMDEVIDSYPERDEDKDRMVCEKFSRLKGLETRCWYNGAENAEKNWTGSKKEDKHPADLEYGVKMSFGKSKLICQGMSKHPSSWS